MSILFNPEFAKKVLCASWQTEVHQKTPFRCVKSNANATTGVHSVPRQHTVSSLRRGHVSLSTSWLFPVVCLSAISLYRAWHFSSLGERESSWRTLIQCMDWTFCVPAMFGMKGGEVICFMTLTVSYCAEVYCFHYSLWLVPLSRYNLAIQRHTGWTF